MRPRTEVIEIFSTFLQFNGDRATDWIMDGRLRRSMEGNLQQVTNPGSEAFWATYWYHVWQKAEKADLAKQHLSAYLQEACFWSARKTADTFSSSQYSLPDFFQIAIANIDRVLKGFDPKQGFVLKNYGRAIFSSVIREVLRQRHEIDICSSWGMLRKISQKRLVESLKADGIGEATIQAYVNAWNCFKLIYVPTQSGNTRQLNRPDEQTWEAITTAYNSQTNSTINAQTLENWLLTCAKAARNYLYPSVTSINQSSGDDQNEWLDNLSVNQQESLLNELIAEEEENKRQQQQQQINQILTSGVADLDPQAQQILELYYRQGKTQQQIAQYLEIQQYTVSRRLTRSREALLKILAKWTATHLHISLDSDLLKSINSVIDEWLQTYYSHPV